MKKAILGCSVALALSLMTACGAAPETSQALENHFQSPELERGATMQQIGYHFLGPGPINYGVRFDDHHDDYLNDGDIHGTPSFKVLDNRRTDLGDDQDKIRYLVANEEGVVPGMVVIIGKDVYVNARFTESLSKEERDDKTKQLEQSLHQAMPRYDIHVNANNGEEE